MDIKKTINSRALSYETRLSLLAILAVIIPLVIFVLISAYNSSQALTSVIKKELEEKSVLVAYNIDAFISERIIDAKVLSQADVLEEGNLPKINQYLTEIIQTNKWIENIDYIDISGRIIASSGEQKAQDKLFTDSYPWSKEIFVATRQASQGDVYVSEAHILDSGLGVLLMTPITDDPNTTVIGVLTLEVNLKNITQIAAIFDKGIAGDKHVYVVDSAGNVITTEDPTVEFLSPLPDLPAHPNLLRAFSQQGAVGNIIYIDSHGDKVMAGYSDMGEFGINNALNWSIIAIAPLDAITVSARKLQQLLLTLGIFIALTATLLVYRYVNKLQSVLQKMAAQANKISLGDFSQQLPFKPQAEGSLGTLVIAFNKMVVNTREMMEKLKEREQNLAITLNSIGDAVITTDANGCVNRMNPIAERLTGWSLQEAKKQPLRTIFPIIDAMTREPLENPVEKVIATGEIVYLSNHTTLISRDGAEYQIADSAAPIRNEVGNVLGMVLVFNDVTEAYRLREQAKSVQQQLQGLFDDMQTMVGILSGDGTLIFVNNTPLKAAGIVQKDVLGKKAWDCPWFTYDPALQNSIQADVAKARAGNNILRDIQIATAGGLLWIEFSIHPVFDSTGEVIQLVAEGRDISTRRQKEEQLRRSQKMDAVGKLTGGVAHDYNNMLGIILGYTELLQSSLAEQPKLESYVNEIYHAAERSAKLTKKLLAFSRQKSNEEEVVNLNTLIYENRHMMEKALTTRVKLVFDLTDEVWPIWLDRGDLEDAIINWSINAMHAIKDNGRLTFRTSNEQLDAIDTESLNLGAGDYVMLSITDTGCGMEKEIIDKIFDPFFTTKGEQGTGLGLSQLYAFVERSGGSIKVYSEPGHGTRITLFFPRYYENENDKKTTAATNLAADTRGNETVLIVDDEPALLNLTANILEQNGYRIICAESAEQALDILEHQAIDLLLSDVLMAEMDGYQLAAIVEKKYPEVKIQLVSGFADNYHMNLTDGDFDRHLIQKPFNSRILLKRIRALLD